MTASSIIVLAIALGLIPAAIARRKDHSFMTWWLFGVLFLIAALPASLLVKDKRPRCPDCREIVRLDAARCPHCQSEIADRILVYRTPSPAS